MDIARRLQARLLPQRQPKLETHDYLGGCIQARQVGGDYYHFLELRPGRVALVRVDIAGKGISGALLMANLRANLRSQYAIALEDPRGLLYRSIGCSMRTPRKPVTRRFPFPSTCPIYLR
jgi:serine phosphatase RsbU (regulator of sigma subunit)